VDSTNNFSAQTPRKSARRIHCGAFQPVLESALAQEVAAHKQALGPLAPVTVVVPTRVLALHLRRKLAPHINVRFQTFSDLLPPTNKPAPLPGLELLCARIARDVIPRDGYFSPVRETRGFCAALRETFTDLKEALIAPDAFHRAAETKKLKELSAAYAEYCRWLEEHDYQTEADLFPESQATSDQSPVFLYGFYDLNSVQKQFIQRLAPSAIFFPWTEHGAPYAQPLLDWFKSLGYASPESRSTFTPILSGPVAPRCTVVSAPGEVAEVREAARAALAYLREHPDNTFNDVAILCRSREPYDAILRDTLAHLGIKAYFRGGRPLAEQSDAQFVNLLLETIRTDFSRASVMELACHLDSFSRQPRSDQGWDALSVDLGIIGGKQQWLARLKVAERERGRQAKELREFVEQLFKLTDPIPRSGRWSNFVTAMLALLRGFGRTNQRVLEIIGALAELDEFESPVEFEIFADFCVRALDGEREPSGQFQGGGIFVGDVMGARGLSFPFVVVLGLVEKNFPRVIPEDPLLLDDERAQISPNLPLKRRGYDEERLLFDLVAGCASDQLVLSYPRLEAGSGRPRVPSYLLLERTGAKTFKALEEQARRIPLSPVRAEPLPLETREFDLPVLNETTAETYLSQISPLLPAGLSAARRWHNRGLTAHDGLIAGREAVQLLHERFVLEKLVISATSLEDFFGCPFYYFQKHVIGIEPWKEPEAALTIDAADLGSLYHKILEDYYRKQPGADLAAIMETRFREFEQSGVTGYAAIWELRKQIVHEEIAAFVRREQADAGSWMPVEFEREFDGIAVAPPVRLHGKIDRIDRDVSSGRLRVLDYKTGRFKKGLRDDDFARGEALQLALYLLATEKLFPGKRVESARYLYFTLRGGYHTTSFSRDALMRRQTELNQLLQIAADMMRDGVFAQYAPTKNDPCRACDFRPICGNGIHKLYRLKNEDPRMTAFRAIKEDSP
jgi:ATP-dependent helicase/nuclease subunit B